MAAVQIYQTKTNRKNCVKLKTKNKNGMYDARMKFISSSWKVQKSYASWY